MKLKRTLVLAALVSASALTSVHAQTVVYGSRGSFEAALSSSLTDTYDTNSGYPGGFTILSDADMTNVLGQTRYQTTGFNNLNILNNGIYCAGCNGSFRLFFDATSYGDANGVGGVGIDIMFNGGYSALVTFGDNSNQLLGLTGGETFWGITSSRQIKSIAFGPGGGTTNSVSFAIDNLTIGSLGTVPEPESWAMLVAGFGLAGAVMRRRRQRVVSA